MRLDWLEYFITTADAGSISAAAERLGMTRPAVSTALKKLEQDVGQELFLKGRAGVSLTPEGERVLDMAQQIMALTEEMRSCGNANVPVSFCVDTQVSMLQYLKETVVNPFKSSHPDMGVRLRPVYIGDVVEEFRRGARLAVVLDGREGRVIERVKGLGCEAVFLGTVTRKMFLGAGHPLAARDTLTPEDLKNEYIAYYSGGLNHISRHYTSYFAGEYRLADIEDVLSLAIRNEAVVILPAQTLRCSRLVRAGALVEKDIPFPGVEKVAPVHAVRAAHLSAVEQLFWDYLLVSYPGSDAGNEAGAPVMP